MVEAHYRSPGLLERLQAALGGAMPAPEALAGLDQFHARGWEATVDLAAALAPQPGWRVLDIGSGLGGPSRYLAQVFGAHVEGIDLSADFVGAAGWLAERCGLGPAVHYRTGDALALPFADGHFDAVWMQHVAMNIADRPRLYAEVARVLRRGGRFATYDVVARDGAEPPDFPLPWARQPADSALETSDAMRALLDGAGLAVQHWQERTAEGVAWFAAQRGAPRPALRLDLAMGEDFPRLSGNLARALGDGRLGLIEAVGEKI